MAENNIGKNSVRAEALARVAMADRTALSEDITFVTAMDRHEGYLTTPAEDFLQSLVMTYAHGRLTPKSAKDKLEEFTENWASMNAVRTRFLSENGISFEGATPSPLPEAPLTEDGLQLGALLEDVAALDKGRRKQMRAFLTVVSANQSNAFTPIENAIVEMAQSYQAWRDGFAVPGGHGLWAYGVDDLREQIDEAETWLKSAVQSARHFNSVYPHLLEAEPEGAADAAA